MAITQGKTPLESVPQAADPERGLKSRMLGNPLVRFCEGQGGNQMMVRVTPNLRAPCLLDPGFNRVTRATRVSSKTVSTVYLLKTSETVETVRKSKGHLSHPV